MIPILQFGKRLAFNIANVLNQETRRFLASQASLDTHKILRSSAE